MAWKLGHAQISFGKSVDSNLYVASNTTIGDFEADEQFEETHDVHNIALCTVKVRAPNKTPTRAVQIVVLIEHSFRFLPFFLFFSFSSFLFPFLISSPASLCPSSSASSTSFSIPSSLVVVFVVLLFCSPVRFLGAIVLVRFLRM